MIRFWRFMHQQDGATSIEYSIVAVLIAATIVTAVTVLSGAVNSLFTLVATSWP